MKGSEISHDLSSDQLWSLFEIVECSTIGANVTEVMSNIPGSFIIRLNHNVEGTNGSHQVGEWNIHVVEAEWEIVDPTDRVLLRFDSESRMSEGVIGSLTSSVVDRISISPDTVELCFSQGLSIRAKLTHGSEDDNFHTFMVSYRRRWTMGLRDDGTWTLKLRSESPDP